MLATMMTSDRYSKQNVNDVSKEHNGNNILKDKRSGKEKGKTKD